HRHPPLRIRCRRVWGRFGAAGRKGGNRDFVASSSEELPKAALLQHRGYPLPPLWHLPNGAFARHPADGGLGDGARDLAAGAPDQSGRLLAGQVRQRAREHERLALQGAALGTALRGGQLKPKPTLTQPPDQVLGRVLGELLLDLTGEDRADSLDL